MTEQSFDLDVELGGYVLDMIGFVRRPQEHCVGTVRLQLLFGKEQVIASRDDTVYDRPAGGTVIRMELVPAPRVMADDHLGPHFPYLPAHDLTQSHGVFELTIGIIEMPYVTGPEHCSGGSLFVHAAPGQLARVDGRVPRALRAVGDDQHRHATSGGRPFGKRAAGAKLDVVGVGPNCQGTRGYAQFVGCMVEFAVDVAEGGVGRHRHSLNRGTGAEVDEFCQPAPIRVADRTY